MARASSERGSRRKSGAVASPIGDRKQVLRALGDLSARIAQELRSSVFDIAAAAQLLRFRAHEDPVIEKSVGRIMRDADRLNRIIAALAEYGRPEPLKLARADPEDVWDKVIDHHRGTLEARSLVVRRTRPDDKLHMHIDREQLMRALEAVFVNATEASPEGGMLQLSGSVDQAGVWQSVLINEGASMPPEAAARAFDLFYTTKPDSVGVGLALAQRIIAEHNGTISLESGDATRVTIALPSG